MIGYTFAHEIISKLRFITWNTNDVSRSCCYLTLNNPYSICPRIHQRISYWEKVSTGALVSIVCGASPSPTQTHTHKGDSTHEAALNYMQYTTYIPLLIINNCSPPASGALQAFTNIFVLRGARGSIPQLQQTDVLSRAMRIISSLLQHN